MFSSLNHKPSSHVFLTALNLCVYYQSLRLSILTTFRMKDSMFLHPSFPFWEYGEGFETTIFHVITYYLDTIYISVQSYFL